MKKRLIALLAALLALACGTALAGGGPDTCSYKAEHGDHDWYQADVSLPTCEESGYVHLLCHSCTAEKYEVTGGPYGHSWEKTGEGEEATCFSSGWYTLYCTECYQEKTVTTPQLKHQWKDVQGAGQPATCLSDGWKVQECSVCGSTQNITLPKGQAPHTFGAWTVTQPTTDHSAGQRTHICQLCGKQESEAVYPDGTLMRGGKVGAEVKQLQQMLSDLGYLHDRVDGDFGKNTEQAVRAFQGASGLTADGIAWPQTRNALSAAWPKSQGPDYGPYCHFTTGEKGEAVIECCQAHAALLEKEAAGGGTPQLIEISNGWLQAMDQLYVRWMAEKPAARDQIEAARQAFYTGLSLQATAMASQGQETVLRWQIGLLRNECMRLCQMLNG